MENKVQTTITNYFSLTKKEKQIITSLTYRYSSGMRNALCGIKHCKTKHTIVLLKNNDKIVAWSLILERDEQLFQYSGCREYCCECMFYVSRKHRRKGFGTILYNQAKIISKEKNKTFYIFYNENPSFFGKQDKN